MGSSLNFLKHILMLWTDAFVRGTVKSMLK